MAAETCETNLITPPVRSIFSAKSGKVKSPQTVVVLTTKLDRKLKAKR